MSNTRIIPGKSTRYVLSNENHLPLLELVARQGYSTGFTILMEHEGRHSSAAKDYSIHPRFSQPCQGGDMRKYESTHKGRCTQPHNGRPGDLTQPFPDGKPSALALHPWLMQGMESREAVFEAVVSDDSPWRKGFGGRDNILRIDNDQGHVEGYILKNLDVDPTVMVSGIAFLNQVETGVPFNELVSGGLTNHEALAFLMLNGTSITSLMATYTYRWPEVFSARRFFDSRPNDLSGGLYSKGADYNRTYIQDVFLGSKEKGGIVWHSAMTAVLGSNKDGNPSYSTEKLIAAAKQVLTEAYQNEPELTDEDTRYVYRDAMAQVLPYPEYALKVNPSLKDYEQKEIAA